MQREVPGLNENQLIWQKEQEYKNNPRIPEIFFLHHLDLTFNLRKKEVINKNKEVKKYIFQENEDGIFVNQTDKDNSIQLNESKDHFVQDDQIFWRIWWKQFRN